MIYNSTSVYYTSYLATKDQKWPKHPQVASDFNLTMFLQYVRMAGQEYQLRLLSLPMIQHQPVGENIQVKLRDGQYRELASTTCQATNCPRCDSYFGGYKFQYIGPWTCQRSIGLSPQQARRTWIECKECTMCSHRPSGGFV